MRHTQTPLTPQKVPHDHLPLMVYTPCQILHWNLQMELWYTKTDSTLLEWIYDIFLQKKKNQNQEDGFS